MSALGLQIDPDGSTSYIESLHGIQHPLCGLLVVEVHKAIARIPASEWIYGHIDLLAGQTVSDVSKAFVLLSLHGDLVVIEETLDVGLLGDVWQITDIQSRRFGCHDRSLQLTCKYLESKY